MSSATSASSTGGGEEVVDLVVVGAGWHGLITAKTYKSVHPTATVLVLDKASTIGGVWAEHRQYPGLKANNMLGTYEYSDFPMTGENAFGLKPGQHIPGEVVQEYLQRFAKKFGVWEGCRFRQAVRTAERMEGGAGWILTVVKLEGEPDESGQEEKVEMIYKLKTRKLVVATGLTSLPYLPTFPGQDKFNGQILHCCNLRGPSAKLFETAKNVVVFGGTKSAWDAAYSFATRGIHVDWIIRESGHGPCWMAPPYVTPLKKWLEKLTSTRFLTWFSPCAWGDADGYTGVRNFLQQNFLGKAITSAFWKILGNDVITLNGYDTHPELAKLKPWVPAFWVAAGLSILNYPTNFFDLVKEGKISVHIADISGFADGNKIYLTSKNPPLTPTSAPVPEFLEADALLCSTGWTFVPPIKFLNPGGDSEIPPEVMGLPYHSSSTTSDEPTASIDTEILTRFPLLQSQPHLNPLLTPLRNASTSPNRPFNLHRFMVPTPFLADRTLAFNGMVQTITTPLLAQAQALWLTSYLSGHHEPSTLKADSTSSIVPPATADSINHETLLHNRFGKWRYPGGYGASYPDFVFDAIPYVDMLFRDLGMKTLRKGGGMRELFEPYGTEDYVGIVEEWMEGREKVGREGSKKDD